MQLEHDRFVGMGLIADKRNVESNALCNPLRYIVLVERAKCLLADVYI